MKRFLEVILVNMSDRGGRVAKGCLSMLSELPLQVIDVSQLKSLVRSPSTCRRARLKPVFNHSSHF